MLHSRFKDDSWALVPLNSIQLAAREQVKVKVECQHYRFETVPCFICGKSHFLPLAEKDRYGLRFSVVICQDCGLVQTNPRMNQLAYDEFYNQEYRRLYVGRNHPEECFIKSQYAIGSHVAEFIQKTIRRSLAGQFVFEVGCGAGGILKAFIDRGGTAAGCDLGQDYLDFGIRHYGLDLRKGTLSQMQLAKPPDIIIYSHVLEHVLDVNSELQKAREILSDTGIVFVAIPGIKNLHQAYRSDFLRFLQNAHTFHFTLTTLRNAFEKNGFALLAGDEKSNAIFAKAAPKAAFENDFNSVMRYLHRAEHRRFYPWLFPGFWADPAKKTGLAIVTSLGMKKWLKRLLRSASNPLEAPRL